MKKVTADIIVVSAGTAGLAAAITGAESGAKVIAFEKLGHTGGSGNMAAGLFAGLCYATKETCMLAFACLLLALGLTLLAGLAKSRPPLSKPDKRIRIAHILAALAVVRQHSGRHLVASPGKDYACLSRPAMF